MSGMEEPSVRDKLNARVKCFRYSESIRKCMIIQFVLEAAQHDLSSRASSPASALRQLGIVPMFVCAYYCWLHGIINRPLTSGICLRGHRLINIVRAREASKLLCARVRSSRPPDQISGCWFYFYGNLF